MSAFYDLASLVVVPSGYKSGKIYAQKPQTTDGQLAFTRASSATRVASNGLIEKVRTNLLLQSNTFTSGSWVKDGCVITAAYGTAPDGTQTASRAVFSAADKTIYQLISATGVAGSLYVKGTAGQTIAFGIAGSESIFTLDGTWQRFAKSIAGITTSIQLNTYGGVTARDILIWSAQLETGDIATDPIATTTAAVSVGPVSGLPRLDYLGSTCPRLLLEPQRTNSFQYSEQLDNAYWSKIGSLTITANNAVSPDGTTNADLVTTTAASPRIQRAFTGLTAGTRTLSCFVKAGTGTEFTINAYDGIVDKGAGYNLSTGVVSYASGGVTATITNYGNGWYRLTHNYTSAGTSYSCQFYFDNIGTYQVYGFQFEDSAAYATSYIPTLGASVTRVADAASKTGITSLIGQTEGTFFIEMAASKSGGYGSSVYSIAFEDGSNQNAFGFVSNTGNEDEIRGIIKYAGSTDYMGASFSLTSQNKLAIAYTASTVKLFRNGSLYSSISKSAFNATISQFYLPKAGREGFYPINQALLFKTALTDAQLAELTTI